MTDMTDADSAGDATIARLYDLGATVLADPPDESLVRTLRDGGFPSPDTAPNDRLAAGLVGLRTWAEGIEDPAEEARRLHAVHTRLFVGPRPTLQIHESWYEGDYLGEPLAAVSADYDALGIRPAPDLKEEADHAAVELAALRELSKRATDDPEPKATFLADHGEWFDAFADDVCEAAAGEFYPAIADLVAGLVALDADRLGVTR
ncbi:MAG: molecular chaperone [Halanaeroarchaeum sp.]